MRLVLLLILFTGLFGHYLNMTSNPLSAVLLWNYHIGLEREGPVEMDRLILETIAKMEPVNHYDNGCIVAARVTLRQQDTMKLLKEEGRGRLPDVPSDSTGR